VIKISGKLNIFHKPDIRVPSLVAAWPGIGNIGLIAINYLKNRLTAEEFGELQTWHFFFPKSVTIKDSVLQDMEFPTGKFYYKKTKRDLIFFLAEMQPSDEDEIYEMANLVLDVAEEFGCQRVYTAGAAVAPIHHTARPRVWAVPNNKALIGEVRSYKNTILMSDLDDKKGQGNITGLNGVLLGVARNRKMEGICFLGEVPMYIAHFPGPYTILYPKASRSILEVLAECLEIQIDMSNINAFANNVEREIESIYQNLPSAIREELDKLKNITYVKQAEPGPITDEEKERIIKEVEEFFRRGGKYDD
jgi:proteasome assembly chaperone (PAC2) family protein